MLRRVCLAIGLAMVACAAVAADGPKDADAQKFVRLTQELEKDPLGDKVIKRQWLLKYAIDSKDVAVTMCNVLGPIPSQEVPNGGELMMQAMFGNAAYQLEHPGTKDEQVLQVAGMESLLRAYASILASDPDARVPFFDEMAAKQASGDLAAAMAPTIQAECIKKQ